MAVQDVGTHGTSSQLREAGGAEGRAAAIYILKLNHQKKCGVKASLFLMHYLGSWGWKASAAWVCISQLLWGKCWGGGRTRWMCPGIVLARHSPGLWVCQDILQIPHSPLLLFPNVRTGRICV